MPLSGRIENALNRGRRLRKKVQHHMNEISRHENFIRLIEIQMSENQKEVEELVALEKRKKRA